MEKLGFKFGFEKKCRTQVNKSCSNTDSEASAETYQIRLSEEWELGI